MIQAVIFDLDGTVLDNEAEWEAAFQAVIDSNQLAAHGWMPNGWMHEPGIGITPNWEKLIGRSEQHKRIELTRRLSRETWGEYEKRIGDAASIPVREGIRELVGMIKEKGWRTALATSSSWNVVADELEQLELYLAFDVTTTGEEVLALKPDPEIYLLTAQKLGVDPMECAVIEDSVAGVQAASGAGMFAVGIASDYAPRSSLVKAGAKLVVENLPEVMIGLTGYGGEKSGKVAK